MGIIVTSPPATLPVDLITAKHHLRVDHDDDDTRIDALLEAATYHVETWTRRALVTRALQLVIDGFPSSGGTLELPYPPLVQVDAIQYRDPDGNTQTMVPEDYQADASAFVGRVRPVDGELWPETDDVFGAVTIDYHAGYGAAEDVPGGVRTAILLHVQKHYDLYAKEGDYLDAAIEALLGPFRVYSL